jgi:hypothetical protein
LPDSISEKVWVTINGVRQGMFIPQAQALKNRIRRCTSSMEDVLTDTNALADPVVNEPSLE